MKKFKRSSLLLKKRKYFEILHVEGSSRLGRKMRLIINKLSYIKKKKQQKINKLDAKKLRELVIYKRPSSRVDLVLDEEELTVWNLLVERGLEEKCEKKTDAIEE